MRYARIAVLAAALVPDPAGAAPYPLSLDARAHGTPFAPCGADCTAVVQAVAARLGEAADPDARLTVTVGALERAPAPPGIGFRFGDPHPDLGRDGAVPQVRLRCEVSGAATPGAWETQLALPEPTALERLTGAADPPGPDRYTGAIADACTRALRAAGLAPPATDLRSSVVVVTAPQTKATTTPSANTPAPPDRATLRRAPNAAQALEDAAPGDVIFEFGQRR